MCLSFVGSSASSAIPTSAWICLRAWTSLAVTSGTFPWRMGSVQPQPLRPSIVGSDILCRSPCLSSSFFEKNLHVPDEVFGNLGNRDPAAKQKRARSPPREHEQDGRGGR